MGGGQELPQAERGTGKENQTDEVPTFSTETPLQKYRKPRRLGCAEKFAQLAQFERENPDFDFKAEDLRKEAEHQAAEIKRRQGKETYFFYGTLMDPETAQKVLGLETPPTMRPAIYRKRAYLKIWGPFPALVKDQDSKVDIKGMACEIEGADRKDRLAAYEGNNYRENHYCLMDALCDDGSYEWVMGITFEWVGSKKDLKDGTFDLEAYKAAKARLDAAEK